MAPATMANMPPETRLARPALVVGMAALELGAADALVEDSVLVGVAEELLLLLIEGGMVLVEVVMVVILVMLSEELFTLVLAGAEVGAITVEVGAMAEDVLEPALEEATGVAP